MPLHEQASYQQDNNWITITPNDLRDPETLAFARTKQLYDSEERRYELFIRNREDFPHFYRKGVIRHNLDRQKDSTEHNSVVKKLLSYLSKNPSIKLKSYFFHSFADKKLHTIKTMKDYSWQDEVTFAISENGYVRFDILGCPISLTCTEQKSFCCN